MNENSMNLEPKPEGKTILTPEDIQYQKELAEEWLRKYLTEEIPIEKRRDCEKEKNELEMLFIEFEKNHSLDDLYAITGLAPEETEKHAIRGAAKSAL